MFYVLCALGTVVVASIAEAIVGENVRAYLGGRKAADFEILKNELSKR